MNTTTETDQAFPSLPPLPASSNVFSLPGLKAPKGKAKPRWSEAALERGYSPIPIILMWGQAKLGLSPEEINVLVAPC
jgi:hypothetical protein